MNSGSSARSASRVILGVAASLLLTASCSGGSRRDAPTATSSLSVTSTSTSTSTDETAISAVPTTALGASTTSTEYGHVVDVRPAVPAIGSTSDADQIAPDGSTRTYRVYVPSGLAADEPVPLLLAFHGGGGSGRQFESNSGFDGLAEANGFIVAYPDGTDIGPALPGRVWNGGRCCGPAQASRDNVDDVGFVSALIDTLQATYRIDADRVYAAGHSNGAIMSYRLACELADKIVAIGVQAGALEVDECRPSQPVSLFHVHGAEDTNVPIDGGSGSGISGTNFASPKLSVVSFAAASGCGDFMESRDPNNPVVEIRTWVGCDDGAAVAMAIVDGANHAWMGHPSTGFQERQVGIPFAGYDSSLAIWTFLAQQAR